MEVLLDEPTPIYWDFDNPTNFAADGPTPGAWDADACYKPFALFDSEGGRWMLWYNGRKGNVEQIGLATHPGYDLGFPP